MTEPSTEPGHDERIDQLSAAIAAATARLADREDLAETDIGELLETLNEEVSHARGEDIAASKARLARIEAHLSDVETRLVEGVVPD